MKYRIQFVKGEAVKYVPHLDMLRLYQRAIRRADLPISYSNGFNPHQQMSFAQPLSVGWTGENEYMDIETTEMVNIESFISKLNSCLVDGTYVKNMRALNDGEKNAMASVKAASYNINLNIKIYNIEDILERFKAESILNIYKKSKHTFKEVNIRELIYEIYPTGNDSIYIFVACGSDRNLKADLLAECLYRYANLDFKPYCIKYERQELFKMKGDDFVSLFCS